MKSFTQKQLTIKVPIALSWLLGSVMESKGKQELFERQRPEVLRTLRELALIQSAESSNRIEGVTVDAKRLLPLVRGKVKPMDRPEEEIVGYRKALDLIHGRYAEMEISPDTLKKLHLLAQGGFSGDAGKFKAKDSDIIELFPDGRRVVRFKTVSAKNTPKAVEQLCMAYSDVVAQGSFPPLLCAASFVFDFLCIHPFRDGNGRVSRLVTLLLLYQQGYNVGRYISLERIIEESKESYYDALKKSSQGWHEGKHDSVPFWSYFLGMVREGYRELDERVERSAVRRGAKTEELEAAVGGFPVEFKTSDVEYKCPNVGKDMVRHYLRALRDKGLISSSGKGRAAVWKKLGNNSDSR